MRGALLLCAGLGFCSRLSTSNSLSAVALATGAGSMPAKTSGGGGEHCEGYLVSGAGDVNFNGCYVQHGNYSGRALFVLDAHHQLYCWMDGPWKIGDPGHNFSYEAITPTPWPPNAHGGCGTGWELGEAGRPPCPAVQRGAVPDTNIAIK